MAADPKEFEALEPILVNHNWRGSVVPIRPLKVGQIPGFAKAAQPILSAIPDGAGWASLDIVGLVGTHGENLIKACAIAVPSIPEDQIRDADLDEFMALIADVISVNVDFFRRRMPQAAPKLAGMLSTIGDGSTPSNP